MRLFQHVRNLLHCERGSPSLEMVLCTPLALLFLFVGIDGGLSFVEKAALADALRSGLNAEGICDTYFGSLTPDGSGTFSIDSKLNDVTQCIASEIKDSIVRTRTGGDTTGFSDFKVSLQPILVDIDPSSGKFLGYRFAPPDTHVGTFDLQSQNPEYPRISKEQFAEDYFSHETARSISQFANPLGVTYSLSNPGASTLQFMPRSLLLYAEVTGATRGINHSYVRHILGNAFVVQKQEIRMLRAQ